MFDSGQKGFTLVELMVSMVVSLIIISSAIYVFSGVIKTSIYETKATKMTQDLRDVMALVSADIRRSGYQGWDAMMNPDATNFYSEVFINPAKDCIYYAYNRNDESQTQGSHQIYGYRWTDEEIKAFSVSEADPAALDKKTCTSDFSRVTSSEELPIDSFSIDTTCTNKCDKNCKSLVLNISATAPVKNSIGDSVTIALSEVIEFMNNVEVTHVGTSCP